MNIKSILSFFIIIVCLFVTACPPTETTTTSSSSTTSSTSSTTIPDTDWTVMIYSAGDCNLSYHLMQDLAEIKNSTNNNMTIIALADTSYNQESTFCEAYKGTRLYQIYNNNARRLSGGDILPEITLGEDVNLNTGDADTFHRFITFCKTYYPAKKYAVFVGGHGIGAVEEKISRSQTVSNNEPQKAMAVDYSSNNDWIFTSELTEAFDDNESIDLLVLDCCTMGFAEVAYQYRPGNGSFNTKYLLASLPQQVGAGLYYEDIFKNVTPTMSAVEFGKLILTQQEAYIKSTITDYWAYSYTEIVAMALYDCSKIEELKNVIDEAVPYLSDKMFLVQNTASRSCGYWRRSYMTSYADYMFDIYDMFTRLADATDDLSADACSKCAEVAQLADDIVLGSFLLKEQTTQYQYPFEKDRSGIAIFLPQNESLWRSTRSYNAIDIPSLELGLNGYGNFAWCIDGCDESNNIADNWFELLDSWYDTTNDETGGLNYYQY